MYVPAAHDVQALVPVESALYAPTTHTVHIIDVVAAAKLPYVPDTHAEHALVPVDSALYVPATHAVHAEAAEALLKVLKVPAGHGKLTGLAGPLMRPPAQYDPGAHAAQPAAGPLM